MNMLPRLLLIAALPLYFSCADDNSSKTAAVSQKQIVHGEKIYADHCASCHGKNLEGQANWKMRKEDGKLPAPPHDETGHTWHHADELLFNMTKFGIVPPYGPENYQSDMPAFKDTLSDQDIWSVIEYIKSTWPEKVRNAQAQMNNNGFKKIK